MTNNTHTSNDLRSCPLEQFLLDTITTYSVVCDHNGDFVCTMVIFAELSEISFTATGKTLKSATALVLSQAASYVRALRSAS